MTEIEEKLFKVACQKCDKVGVKFNENILNIYSLEEFLKIANMICRQKPSLKLPEIITCACHYNSKASFIEQMLATYSNYQETDEYMYKMLTRKNFYSIKSDFEKLIMLNRLTQTDNIQEKSMLYYLSAKTNLAAENSVYDIFALVTSILDLEDEKLGIEIIIKIQEHPSILQYYSTEQLAYIIKLYAEYPCILSYFFNSRVTNNMTAKEALKIFEQFSLITKARINDILKKISIYIFNGQKPFDELMADYQNNLLKEKPTNQGEKIKSIHYFPCGIDQSGTWIDNLSAMK